MRLPFLLFIIFISATVQSQNLAIGEWREHLPFNRGKALADGGSKLYCATEDALFAYVKEDASLERYTRLSGLHDFGIASIAYSKDNQTLPPVGYPYCTIAFLPTITHKRRCIGWIIVAVVLKWSIKYAEGIIICNEQFIVYDLHGITSWLLWQARRLKQWPYTILQPP